MVLTCSVCSQHHDQYSKYYPKPENNKTAWVTVMFNFSSKRKYVPRVFLKTFLTWCNTEKWKLSVIILTLHWNLHSTGNCGAVALENVKAILLVVDGSVRLKDRNRCLCSCYIHLQSTNVVVVQIIWCLSYRFHL